MNFEGWTGPENAQRNAAWALVIALWGIAISMARNEEWVVAITLVASNFEIIKRSRNENSFADYLNAIIFHLLFYFYIKGYYIKEYTLYAGKFRSELVLLLETAAVAFFNTRYRFLSLRVMTRFLILGSAVSLPFTLWKIAFVPRLLVPDSSVSALEFYRYWMMPIEMLLVATPFVFTALANDLRDIKTGHEKSSMLDVYYLYSLPLLAFGLFPGVGISLHANCGLNSTYVAIGGVVVLVLVCATLSLITNRKSILLASMLAALPLGVNLCVKVPSIEIVSAVCVVMLLAWRWLPKGLSRVG